MKTRRPIQQVVRARVPTPAPTQLCVWYEENIGTNSDDFGQYLYALKATQPGDRQLVWEGGGSERGIVGLVDFDSTSVLANGRYYSFGNSTQLTKPISKSKIARVPELNDRFLGSGRSFLAGGPKGLAPDIVAALGELAGGWPPQSLPTGDPMDEPFDVWHGALDIDPEKVFELAIIADRKLRDRLGFSSAIRSQVWISDRSRPDLLDENEGIVGEVKRVIRAKDVKQVERYLEDLGDPDWRAMMIHHADMSDTVADALDDSKDSSRIEVWRLDDRRNGKFKAVLEREPGRRSGHWRR